MWDKTINKLGEVSPEMEYQVAYSFQMNTPKIIAAIPSCNCTKPVIHTTGDQQVIRASYKAPKFPMSVVGDEAIVTASIEAVFEDGKQTTLYIHGRMSRP